MNRKTDKDFTERLKAFSKKEKEDKGKARRILAFFAGSEMGDYVRQTVATAALTRPLQVYVAAVYKDHPPYRSFIGECNPYINTELKADGDAPMTMPIDWFDIGVFAPVKCQDPQWTEKRLGEPDAVFLPGMLRTDLSRLSGLAETPPLFQLPPEREEYLLKSLAERGLDSKDWFTCLHVTGNPESHLALIRHIIGQQRGRVVIIGTPEAKTTLEMKGVIHLSQSPDSIPDHVTAISQARYFMGDVYGSIALASAFRTPLAATNALQYGDRMWNKGDVVLAKKMIEPNGTQLSTLEAFNKGYLDSPPPETVTIQDNTAEELIAVSDHMLDLTSDCTGWREPPEETVPESANVVTFPFSMRDKPLLTFWE